MAVFSGMMVLNASKESPFLRIVNCISGLSENSLKKQCQGYPQMHESSGT